MRLVFINFYVSVRLVHCNREEILLFVLFLGSLSMLLSVVFMMIGDWLLGDCALDPRHLF